MSNEPEHDVRPFKYLPAPAGHYQSAAYIREQIESLEEDVRDWQKYLDWNRAELPRIERECLQYQLDIAQTQLKIYELRAKLAAKTTLHEQLRASVAKEGGVA